MTYHPRRWSLVTALSLAALLAVGGAARAEDRPEHEREGGRPAHAEPGHASPPAHAEPGHAHAEPGRAHAEPGHAAPGRIEPGRVEPGRRVFEREHAVFHERDVRRFRHEDMVRWRGGRWSQTCYFGRCGWWWFAGGMWYFYDRPVYPYPLVVGEVTYLEPVPVAPPPVVVVEPAPPPPPPPPQPVQAAPQYWYWCDNPQGYYPYVQACSVEFRQVPVPVNNAPPR